MLKKLWQAIRPAIFWSYGRGSWQYDLIVVGILAFIFLTPRDMFRDQPRPPSVQQINLLPDHGGNLVFWVEPSVIEEAPPEEITHHLEGLLRQRTGRHLQIVGTKPVPNTEGDAEAYLVYARPLTGLPAPAPR